MTSAIRESRRKSANVREKQILREKILLLQDELASTRATARGKGPVSFHETNVRLARSEPVDGQDAPKRELEPPDTSDVLQKFATATHSLTASQVISNQRIPVPAPFSRIGRLEQLIDYKFKDPGLACDALQISPGAVRDEKARTMPNRGADRLAIIGDIVLSLVLAQDWYRRDSSTGQWARIHHRVATNLNLTRVGVVNLFHELLPSNHPARNISSFRLATTVEAVLGAIYLDSGAKELSAVAKVMAKLGLVANWESPQDHPSPGHSDTQQ